MTYRNKYASFYSKGSGLGMLTIQSLAHTPHHINLRGYPSIGVRTDYYNLLPNIGNNLKLRITDNTNIEVFNIYDVTILDIQPGKNTLTIKMKCENFTP